MSTGACGWSDSLHRDAARLSYDEGSQTAECPGCNQRVPVQAVIGKRGRLDAIKLSMHAKPDTGR